MPDTNKNFHTAIREVCCFEDAIDFVEALSCQLGKLDEDEEAVKAIQGYLTDCASDLNYFIDQRNMENTSEYDEYVAQHRLTAKELI